MKIIGLGGVKGSGKNTVAKFFVESEKFVEVALATPLKNTLSKLTGLESKYFHDQILKEKELPYFITIDHDFLDRLYDIVENEWGFIVNFEQRDKIDGYAGTQIKTARELMQLVGTDILRKHVRDDIWIVLLFSKIKEITGNVIINDVRFENEREALKKAGAKLMLIKRTTLKQDNHKSENDLGKDSEYDAVINNNEISLGQLRSEVLMWYTVAVKGK